MLKNLESYMQFILKKIYGLGLFILLLHTIDLYSNSNQCSFSMESNKSTLPDVEFQKLKTRVIKYLDNSWCSSKKAELLMDLIFAIRPKICVEVGVFSGSSVLPVAATLNYLKTGCIYAIDAWSNLDAVKYMSTSDPNYTWWSQVNMKEAKNKFTVLINQWHLRSCCYVIHATSEMAISQIPEIDFLHLDGNFCEEGALIDVGLFLPRVKPGGYVLLSNLFQVIDNKLTRMSSMWRLFDECEIIYELDNNTALFRKN